MSVFDDVFPDSVPAFAGDLNVTGDLNVGGVINATSDNDLNIVDSFIVLNDGEVGAGVTTGSSGVEIDRGSATNYQIAFVESDDKLKAGLVGELRVVTRGDVGTRGYIPFGISEGDNLLDSVAGALTDDVGDPITDNTSVDKFLTESSSLFWDNNIGRLGIGTSTPTDTLEVVGDVTISGTGYLKIPSGTTAQRTLSPVNGQMRYNTDLNALEVYQNGSYATSATTDHTTLSNIGTNSHTQIDTAIGNSVNHIADSTLHFTEGSIDHTAIANIGTNTHAQIDTAVTASTNHIADGTLHFTEGSIDHGSIAGLGDDDHTQYALADGTRSFSGEVTVSSGGLSITGNVGLGLDATTTFGNLHVRSASSGAASADLGADELTLEGSGDVGMTILGGATSNCVIAFGDSAGSLMGRIDYDHNDNSLSLWANEVRGIHIENTGQVGIGTAVPDEALHVVGNVKIVGTGSVQLSSGTTAQRPTASAGMIRWNSDNTEAELYDGTNWRGILLSSPV
ncbi:hypothetical protein N9937_02165 [bacterium]|nr:hypothetical protein [bacterium]